MSIPLRYLKYLIHIYFEKNSNFMTVSNSLMVKTVEDIRVMLFLPLDSRKNMPGVLVTESHSLVNYIE